MSKCDKVNVQREALQKKDKGHKLSKSERVYNHKLMETNQATTKANDTNERRRNKENQTDRQTLSKANKFTIMC